jgi:hypothetical protein
MRIPDHAREQRARVLATFLRHEDSNGIEIGALDEPTPLPPGAAARYVDFHPTAELARQYPELDPSTLAAVDVIDDGERLDRFTSASVDFLIANQMLEHCENPLGTLRRHLEVVRPAGWLFYALPDRRVTFDHARPLTTFDHLVEDDRDQGAGSRFGHYLEWATLVNGIADAREAHENAEIGVSNPYSIHFHVWDANTWLEHLVQARSYLDDAFDVWYFEFTGTEILCALRRMD